MNETTIAYFSMEIELEAAMPTYAGGLGVLAGDTLRGAADLQLPMVAVSLLHRKGYLEQRLEANEHDSPRPADQRTPCVRCGIFPVARHFHAGETRLALTPRGLRRRRSDMSGMALAPWWLMHAGARLSAQERESLVRGLENTLGDAGEEDRKR